uniref:Uncharacterized protein n=1 Tax=Neovison vison TaxID=452646 RepID=A0A8C7ELI8_NEOVI
ADVRGFWSTPSPGSGGWGRAESAGPASLQEPSLYTIKAVFILDNDGHRLLAKVSSHPHLKVLRTLLQSQEQKSPPR